LSSLPPHVQVTNTGGSKATLKPVLRRTLGKAHTLVNGNYSLFEAGKGRRVPAPSQ